MDSYYEPFKSGKTIITYDPYKKYKNIAIDTNLCRIIREKDFFVRPIAKELYESIKIHKYYTRDNILKLDSYHIYYDIEFLKPLITTGYFNNPPLKKGERPEWWYYNKDSLFTKENLYKNDSIFSKVISRNRRYHFEITKEEADSMLFAWGLGKYRGDIPKREP